MTDPRSLSIKDFTYALPEERIARYPLADRDASRLLIYDQGQINESIYRQIAHFISPGSLLIFNNTRVVEARLFFQKPTGGVIEIFCLEPHPRYPDITTAMQQHEKVLWCCLIGGASKWKHGQVLEKKISKGGKEFLLRAVYLQKLSDSFIVELSWNDTRLSFAEVLHSAGAIPLPPYLKREAEASDAERYQTIFADQHGSVAAPTAGLHFTRPVFDSLEKKNIQTEFITLHVGAGTFKPVKSETMLEHEIHAEFLEVTKSAINNILCKLDEDIIAVGTTSLRTLESLYWLGVKLSRDNGTWTPELTQWEVYELEKLKIPVRDSLQAILNRMTRLNENRLIAKTQIIIAPGYQPKVVTGLITNFHQPSSTLLLLVAALIGDDWKKVYEYALEKKFRFLSYGDGCLLRIHHP